MLRAALAHHRAGRAEAAAALYQRVLRQSPGHADALHLFGVLRAQAGRLEEALPLLIKAARRAPRNAGFLNDLANVFNGLGRFDEAEAHYRRAAAFDKSNADIRYNFGHALRAAGRPVDAVEWFEKALAIRPDHGSAQSELGLALLEIGRAEDAVAALRQTVALNEDAASAHSDLGNALQEVGTLEEAEASLRRAIDLDPKLAAAHANLGNVLQDLHRVGEAEAAYREAIALDAEYAAPHANLGNALKRLGREDEAVASLERALELKPENATYRANLGMVHVARGDSDAALACFGRAAARRHGPPLTPAHADAAGNEERPAVPVAPFKLQHDAEQIRRLCSDGRIDRSFDKIADAYEQVLAALPSDAPPDEPLALDNREWRRIAPAYNRPLYLPEAPAAAKGAVNPDLNSGEIERAYRESAPNLVVVDDFLTADALERLWRFCLDATVWYQVKRGYLGAYLVDGFGTALALQIADELRASSPASSGPIGWSSSGLQVRFPVAGDRHPRRFRGGQRQLLGDTRRGQPQSGLRRAGGPQGPRAVGLGLPQLQRRQRPHGTVPGGSRRRAGDGALPAEPRGDLRLRSLSPHRRSRLPTRLREPAHQRDDALRQPRRTVELGFARPNMRRGEDS